jgi:hypothetical protein
MMISSYPTIDMIKSSISKKSPERQAIFWMCLGADRWRLQSYIHPYLILTPWEQCSFSECAQSRISHMRIYWSRTCSLSAGNFRSEGIANQNGYKLDQIESNFVPPNSILLLRVDRSQYMKIILPIFFSRMMKSWCKLI